MKLSRFAFLAGMGGVAAASTPAPARAALPPWFPLPPPLRPKLPARALVLSGAGARGAYEAGVLKWLYRNVDAEQPFDYVSGTSAGAINAAFAARATSESISQAQQLWLGMPQSGVVTLIPPAQHAVSAAQSFQESSEHGYPRKLRYLSKANSELKAMGPKEELVKVMGVVSSDGINALVKKYPFTLAEMKTGLIINATNMTRFSSDSFYHFVGAKAAAQQTSFLTRMSLVSSNVTGPPAQPTGQRFALTENNLVPAVLASAAVPGVFQPVEVPIAETASSDVYVDGGVANNTPVSTAVLAGATDVTVVIASSPGEGMSKQPDTLPKLLQGAFAVIQRELLEDDIRIALARNLLSRYRDYRGLTDRAVAVLHSIQASEWVPITLRIIRPVSPLKLTSIGFDDATDLQAAFDQGYADAQNPNVFTI